MEICKSVIDGLSFLQNDTRVSEDDLRKILTITSHTLISNQVVNDLKSSLVKCEFKLLSLSLATIFIQASRMNKGIDEETDHILNVLQEAGVDEKYHFILIKEYQNIAGDLKNLLMEMKINGCQDDQLSTLIDIVWRQDLIIRSKLRPQIFEINYLISLKTKENDDFQFSINSQGLQNLNYQLQDCCKIFENTFKQCL